MCVDTRWQSQHLTLKKNPTQRKYRSQLQTLRLKKSVLILKTSKVLNQLQPHLHSKYWAFAKGNTTPLSGNLKLNWLDFLTGITNPSLLPVLHTNPITVRLKNSFNWFKEQPYLFLNKRPDKPTKSAFLTHSTLFQTFLSFKKTIHREVTRQKPFIQAGSINKNKRIFRLKNNLNLIKLLPFRDVTRLGTNDWNIGVKFKLLLNHQRLYALDRKASVYKSAYTHNTSHLTLTYTQGLINMRSYQSTTTSNLTWWVKFSKNLFNKSPRVLRIFKRFKQIDSRLVYLSRQRFFKFKTVIEKRNRVRITRKFSKLITLYQRQFVTGLSNSSKSIPINAIKVKSRKLWDDDWSSMMVNAFYDAEYNECKQVIYKLRAKKRNTKALKLHSFSQFHHIGIKQHYHNLIMSSSLLMNHTGKLAAGVLRFLLKSQLLTTDNPRDDMVKAWQNFNRRTRRSHSVLRKTVFSLSKYESKKKSKRRNRGNKNPLKNQTIRSCYNTNWVYKHLLMYSQLFQHNPAYLVTILPSNTKQDTTNRYYPSLQATTYLTTITTQNPPKVTLSTKLHLVSLYDIPFILKPYAFVYTNTLNSNDNRSLVHNVFPLFKYRRYVHSFLYKNEVKRYILKRHKVSRSHFSTEPTAEFFENIRTFKDYVYRYRRVHLNNLTPSAPQSYFNTPDDRSVYDPMHDTLKIKRVRFKPGYYRLWRNARAALKESLNLSFRYQHRLTSYLPRFYKLSKFQTLHAIETKLTSILIYTNLIPDYEFSKYFIDNNLVYVNGILANQYNEIIVLHDFIQLVVSLKFYIANRWLTNWKLKKQLRLKKLANAKYNNQSFRLDKQSSDKLPKWIYSNKYRFYDVPNYLEVDYFTLSAFTIYDPFLITDFNPINSREFRVSIYKNYNWKYIT